MNKVAYLIFLLLLSACVPIGPTTIASKSLLQNPQHSYIHYATPTRCTDQAKKIAPMVLQKWMMRDHQSSTKRNHTQNWKLLALVHHDTLLKTGLTKQEILHIAKQIYYTDISEQMEYDMLSYTYYYKAKCALQSEGIHTLPLKKAYKMLNKCWSKGRKQGLQEELCMKRILARELIL